ncbi:hypothetical protein V1508DRAFT_120230 [Lipomyces doorenjongii]|uniref:uncharacterized protein n=1 Tax=Lipomyces doorenjongii TaxID=383834 RepID=UPI0034D003AA
MRRIKRLFVLLVLLFMTFIVFFRVTAPAYPERMVSITEELRHAQSGLSHQQHLALSPFIHLGNSLTAAAAHAHSVLFVAGSTKAASRLIQLANDLAFEFELSTRGSRKLSYRNPAVHLLFMGPYSVNLDFFAKANGANSSLLFIHDGRAKLNQQARLLPTVRGEDSTVEPESLTMFDVSPAAVRAAMETTYRFLRPDVTIWSRQSEANGNFGDLVDSLLGDPSSHWAPIDLPAHDMEELRWLAFLGVDGLKYWSRHAFDIIIPVIAHTGSLIRLLDSIAQAHYYNYYPRPRITIYLAPGPADPSLINYIERTLPWPRERIFLQSVPSSAVSAQQDALREAIFAAAIRSHVPSSKHAHAIVLADTVRLSKYWFHWTLFHLLRFSGSVMDTEMTKNLAPLAGISLCPIANETGLTYFLTQSKLSLSCTMFFPPHFRVLQSYLSEHSANTVSQGLKRTLPVPEELSFLKSDVKSSQTDMHEFFLPLYMRGYLFLSQTSMLVPAVDDLLITAKEKRLQEPPHTPLELPLYDWIIETGVGETLPALDTEDEPWTGLPVIPDWNSEASSSVERVAERGVEFIRFVSPRCNVAAEVAGDESAVEEKEPFDTLWGSRKGLRLEGISRIDDDWSDVFCEVKEAADQTIAETGSAPERAKTREDEKRERKATKVVNAAKERRPSAEKSLKGTAKPVQAQKEAKTSVLRVKVAEKDETIPEAKGHGPAKESFAGERST